MSKIEYKTKLVREAKPACEANSVNKVKLVREAKPVHEAKLVCEANPMYKAKFQPRMETLGRKANEQDYAKHFKFNTRR